MVPEKVSEPAWEKIGTEKFSEPLSENLVPEKFSEIMSKIFGTQKSVGAVRVAKCQFFYMEQNLETTFYPKKSA